MYMSMHMYMSRCVCVYDDEYVQVYVDGDAYAGVCAYLYTRVKARKLEHHSPHALKVKYKGS